MPFSMNHSFYSHISITHCALVPSVVSSLSLRIYISPTFGWRFPTLVFQSPHITDRTCGGMCPTISSISFRASSSAMPRVCKLVAGGRQVLPIHIISPPCPWIPTPYAYSLPTYFNTFMPFLISKAIPPLLSVLRRSSQTRYPGISSVTEDYGNHVSWTHSTSKVCVSSIILILNRLVPAQLKLPTVSPSISQRAFLSILVFRRRAEPLVRFFCLPLDLPWPIYWP